MEAKLKLILFLTIIVNCNGHLGILKDILTTAHDRVHDTAKTILGGFNIGFQIGGHGTRYTPPPPPPNYHPPDDKTIIVVVEEDQTHHRPNPQYPQNGFRPPYNNNGQGNTPNGPGYNDFNSNYQNNYDNINYNPNNRPGNYGQNQNVPGNNYGNNGHSNPNQVNPNYNNNPGTPTFGNNNINQQINPDYNNQNVYPHNNQNTQPNNPTEYTTVPSTTSTTPVITQQTTKATTKRPDSDEPLFVPLNHNDYIYTGDKIYTGAPKREVENPKPAENQDDDFEIDVRLKGL